MDVEHVVVFMQENRPFDMYYGMLNGVRGFNDHAAPDLPTGRSPFHQPLATAGPFASSCHGWTCFVENQLCLPGTPGATPPNGNRCCAGKWLLGNATCATIPNATDCTASACETQNQLCPVGAKGAGSTGKRCCAGLWAVIKSGETACEIPYMLPWHVDTSTTSGTCMPSPGMGFGEDVSIWNQGQMDAWATARAPGFGLGYFEDTDLPWYHKLANNFLVGDQYFQSTFTATCPNREHLFAGTNNNIRTYQQTGDRLFQMLDDAEPTPGFTWETLAETFEKEGISWKVYQEEDNFDDNGFAWFESFQQAKPGDALYEKGIRPVDDIVQAFHDDLGNSTLPQVSIVIAPAWRSEHASNHPADGEDLSAQLIKTLSDPAHSDVYSKTVFILNYDEGGQFYDHHWTPVPPRTEDEGKSTVDTVGDLTVIKADGQPANTPMGMGFRVPLIIISPWTRGNIVYSEVTDHTSVLRFLEKRFGIECPNITPWRRAIAGDLTHAFDWDHPDYTWPILPDTTTYVNESKRQCDTLPSPVVPTKQSMPRQYPGTRASRALPYEFVITVSAQKGALSLFINNTGTQGAAFQVYDKAQPLNIPRKYSVEGLNSLKDIVWPSATSTTIDPSLYSLALHGPNGFVREFSGQATTESGMTVFALHDSEVSMKYATQRQTVLLELSAPSTCTEFVATDRAYGSGGPWKKTLSAGSTFSLEVDVSISGNWYDLEVTAASCDSPAAFLARGFKGRMETGEDTVSDPAMASPAHKWLAQDQHPVLSRELFLPSTRPLHHLPVGVGCGHGAIAKDLCTLD